MAGSFHVDAGDSQVGWVNRCRVLDGFGTVLFSQDKCVPFVVPADQAAGMNPALLTLLGIDQGGGYEDIRLSQTFSLFDCALGRLGTVCRRLEASELIFRRQAGGRATWISPTRRGSQLAGLLPRLGIGREQERREKADLENVPAGAPVLSLWNSEAFGPVPWIQ
jgi:hypothetical protein